MDKYITTPITEEISKDLHSGDYVYISGTIYVARDAAHKRLIELLQQADPDGNKEVVISDEHNYTPDGVEEYGDYVP